MEGSTHSLTRRHCLTNIWLFKKNYTNFLRGGSEKRASSKGGTAQSSTEPVNPTLRKRNSCFSSSCQPRRHSSVAEKALEGGSAMAGSDLVHPGLAIVIMGVSGCGKSTVAARLAAALGCSFVEADDYHSQANKAKMSMGIPLTDADRSPWLESIRDTIRDRLDRGEDVAVSCSALRLKYREVLREGDIGYKAGEYATCRVKFVCLEASAELIAARVQRRAMEGGHFMPASLVQSQLDLLEIDEAEGITVVDATVRPDAIVEATIAQFSDELASTALLRA